MTIKQIGDFLNDKANADAVISASISSPLSERVEEIYLLIYKSPIRRSCSNCVADAFFQLLTFYKKNKTLMEKQLKCKYRLKNGAIINFLHNGNKIWSNANLTDEVAEVFIKQHPNNKQYFAVLPPAKIVKETAIKEEVKIESK